jgi:hypothetical protein
MSATTAPVESTSTGQDDDLTSMFAEIATAVATGLVPFVGQAINIYDTIESLITLNNSDTPDAKNEAKFDLVLALIGWIPGAGGGVKKTFRIINKNPERYAPLLFDVLRMVCVKIGIQTSPESLLDQLFDAAGLKSVLGTVQTSVEKSWAYEQMPSEGQMVLTSTMNSVRLALPAMLIIVSMKLLHWKSKQRNSAARVGTTQRKDPGHTKPGGTDPNVGKKGPNAPKQTASNSNLAASIGTATIDATSNTITGIMGEHITDYFLYEEYGWGRDWSQHDRGTTGSWKTRPGREYPGKLNEGTKLNQLLAPKAHGTGIDGVWKVQRGDPHNDGKPYAIVESKASANETAPKNLSRKPPVRNKLLDNARRIKNAALPKTADLLDPPTPEATAAADAKKSGGRPPGGQSARARKKTRKAKQSAPTDPQGTAKPARSETPMVQMSQKWIAKNIRVAVSDFRISQEIVEGGTRVYSRHLIFTPFYLPSVAQHVLALKDSVHAVGESAEHILALHEKHKGHAIPSTHRHDEKEVKAAVNYKLQKLNLDQEA